MSKSITRSPVARRSINKSRKVLLAGVSAMAGVGFVSPAMAATQTGFGTLSALAGSGAATPDRGPRTPIGASVGAIGQLGLADLQVAPLAIGPAPVLSAGLVDAERTVRRGQAATFLGFSNYPLFIVRAELRIFSHDVTPAGVPHAIIGTNADGVARWTPSTYAADQMYYVYRVYDAAGNFDETHPQTLDVLSAAHLIPPERTARPDFGTVDTAALRTIPLAAAGAVMVSGQTGAPDQLVRVSGQIVPGDSGGHFATWQIVPSGCCGLQVAVTRACGTSTAAQVPIGDSQTPAHQAAPFESAGPVPPSPAPASSDGLSITVTPQDQPPAENPYAIRVRSDASHVDPVLAVGLAGSERTVVRGRDATFVSYTNYPALIARQELRVFRSDQSPDSAPVAVVAANNDGIVHWTPAADTPADLFYVYRVYDRDGRFDETRARELAVVDAPYKEPLPPKPPLFGTRDEAGLRNISFAKAATVTVTGKADAAGEVVRVAGRLVPIEADGTFTSQQIVARDTSQVWVTVGPAEQARFAAVRDVKVRRGDWFVVGQGDLTLVSNRGNGPAVDVSGDPLASGDHLASRAAFYAKGTLANGVKITSSLDTGETLLRDLFSNIDRKDPRQLLRRMDSNQYYTTYGDDSTLVEDAPTQGRFYLRVQKDRSSLLIGNFVADIQQTELARLNRGLFGAIVDHSSLGHTSFGDSKLRVTGFASDPGSVPGRDEFRGTGGSLFYLKRRDLTVGSERLTVEVRDRDTGIVLSRHDLKPQEDYDIDYFQGRLTLLRPLPSSISDDSLVRDASLGGNIPVLVVNYEYTPAVGDIGGYTYGGRAAAWLGDTVRLGVTAQRETTGSADQTLLGTDATIRVHAGTFVKAELAQSDGPGFGQASSVDGGLSFADQGAAGRRGTKARAWRTELGADLAELRGKAGNLGKVSAYYEQADAGFGANGQLTNAATRRWGASLAAPLDANTAIVGKVQYLSADAIGQRTVASGEISQQFGSGVQASLGLKYSDQSAGLPHNSTEVGMRTDVAAELAYRPGDRNWSLHAFGQATIDRQSSRQPNNRAGLGAKLEISDRQSLAAEASYGDGGLAANVELTHRYGNGSETYLGYALVTDRTDLGLEPATSLVQTSRGNLALGTRHRFSSAFSIHGENKIGYGGEAPSIMHSFGFDFDPSERWSFNGTFENGHVDSAQTGRFRRTAATIGAGYTGKTLQFGTNAEARFEQGNTKDQTVWLFRNHGSVQITPDWRALGQLNFAIANNDASDVRAADFVEGTVGLAYRPVLNDRFNLLARYTYLKDMGPIGQITQGGQTASPKQKSRIFSIDGNFDLTDTLTIGAKYALRQGSVSLGRESDTYVSSNTQLAVLRADWRLVKNWDALIEGHRLTNDQAGDRRWGGVAALYRHLTRNVKIGAGYSFSDFSSDLGDQSYTSEGFFINLLGKF